MLLLVTVYVDEDQHVVDKMCSNAVFRCFYIVD